MRRSDDDDWSLPELVTLIGLMLRCLSVAIPGRHQTRNMTLNLCGRFCASIAMLGIALLLSPSTAAAVCVCFDKPVCQVFPAATDVFVAKVTAIARNESNRLVARLAVSEVLKGSPGSNAEFGIGEECDPSFETGQEYLVYASRREGTLTTEICSRNLPLSHPLAQQDLRFIRSLGDRTRTASFYGSIAWPDGPYDNTALLEHLKAIVEGSGRRYEMLIDGQDPFEVDGILPGSYRVRIMREGRVLVRVPGVIHMSAGACVGRNISLRHIRTR
jgi:hypothetical protein